MSLKPVVVLGKDCDICFDEKRLTIKCIWGCSICVCRKCISKMLKLSYSGVIYYNCPQCRRKSLNVNRYITPNSPEHKKSDKKTAVHVVIIGVLMNFLMFLVFFMVSKMPADMAVGSQKEFGQVLVASWRIILASIIAMFFSELVDTNIYQWYSEKFKKYQFMRIITSNFVWVVASLT